MNHPELPVSAHAEVADLVQLDSRGRARRPDGSMMKAGELAAIKAFQEDVREGVYGLNEPASEPTAEISEIVPLVVKHRTEKRTWVTRDAGPAKHFETPVEVPDSVTHTRANGREYVTRAAGPAKHFEMPEATVAVPEPNVGHRANGRKYVTRAAGPAKHYEYEDDALASNVSKVEAPEPRKSLKESDPEAYTWGLVDKRLTEILDTHPEIAAIVNNKENHDAGEVKSLLEALIVADIAAEGIDISPLKLKMRAPGKPSATETKARIAPKTEQGPDPTVEPAAAEPESEELQTPVVAAAEASTDNQQPTPIVDPGTLASLMNGKDSPRPGRHRTGFLERMRGRRRKVKNGAVLLATGAGRRPQEQRDPEALQKRNDRVMPVLVAIGAVALLAVAAKVGSHDSHSTILDLVPKNKGGHGGHHGYDVVAGKSLSPKHAHAGVLQHSPKHVTLRKGDNDWTTSRHELGSHASVAQVNQVDHAIMHLNHQTEESARHLAVGTKVKLPVKMIASIRKTLRH